MSIIQLLIILLIPCTLAYGGYQLNKQLKNVEINSVSGALLVVIGFSRFYFYMLAFAAVIALPLLAFVSSNEGNDASLFNHSFELVLDQGSYSVSRLGGEAAQTAEIFNVSGEVEVVGKDWVVALGYSIGLLVLAYLMHHLLSNAQRVVKSLHDRNPFDEMNAFYTRRIAVIALWITLLYALFQFFMTIYLQNQITVEGLELQMGDMALIRNLLIAGIFYMMSEVFRVGYEIKEEQALTV